MVNLIVAGLIIICAIAILVILAPRIKQWVKERQDKESGEKIPVFGCSLVNKGNKSEWPNSEDIYDCVEDKGKHKRLDPK